MDKIFYFCAFCSCGKQHHYIKLFFLQLTLHERGQQLDMSVYDQASLALDDDYEDVRLAAIKLVWVFSQADPERLVILAKFLQICEKIVMRILIPSLLF